MLESLGLLLKEAVTEGSKEMAMSIKEFNVLNEETTLTYESEIRIEQYEIIEIKQEVSEYSLQDINDYNPEICNPEDIDKLKEDDIGLQDEIRKFDDPEFINEVRDKNENMDNVLTKSEEILKNDPSDLEIQRVDQNLERYKGTIFENELKDVLDEKFETVEDKQRLVETEFGATKPDVVLKDAKQDMKISDLEVKKGEDLYIEAKCGSPEYIRQEMNHILKQVEGHEGNSLVVVTKDYEMIDPEIRARFESELKDKGSHIYIADVSSKEISFGIKDSLKV